TGFQSDGYIERHLGQDRTKRWRKINPSDPELYHGQMRLLQWHDYLWREEIWRAIILRGGLSAKSPSTRYAAIRSTGSCRAGAKSSPGEMPSVSGRRACRRAY